MGKFFTLTFWFSSALGPLTKTWVILLSIIFGGMAVLGIFADIMAHLKRGSKIGEILARRVYFRFYRFLLTMGVIGLGLVFLEYEDAPFLDKRFYFFLWAVGTCLWLFFVLKYCFKEIPRQKKEMQEKENFEKYLP